MQINLNKEETRESIGNGAAEPSFSQQLEAYEAEKPKKGQILNGTILSVDDDSVLMDIGAKSDAVVPRKELEKLDESLRETLKPGESLPVYVIRTPIFQGRLLVSIDRGLAQHDWDRAEGALDSEEVLDLKITGMNRGGITVAYGRLQGFVPNSLIPGLRGVPSIERDEVKQRMIGESIPLKVIEVIPKRKRLILSGIAAEKEDQRQRLEELEVGQIITGRIVNIVDFGAFIDLGGVDGLMHISEYDHIASSIDLQKVLEIGDEIEVKINDIDREKQRISLSRKALLPSPWSSVEEHYSDGDLVEGEVTNVTDFGAFVQLPEGVEGLIHESEMDIIRYGGPEDILSKGQNVLVKILSIESDRQRISLSIRQVSQDERETWEPEAAKEPVEAVTT